MVKSLGTEVKAAPGVARLVSRSRRLEEDMTPTAIYGKAEPREAFRVFWSQRDGQMTLVGLGVAWGVRVSGEGRFREAREWYRDLVTRAEVEGSGVVGTGPLAVGGFRFDIEAETSPEWDGFGDGIMVVPRVCYAWTPDGNWVTENWLFPANGEGSLPDLDVKCRGDESVEIRLGERGGWGCTVIGALESVKRTEVEKVVMARRVGVKRREGVELAQALGRLTEREERCSVFAFGVGGETFMGATPEPLVSMSGWGVECICHAGSVARGSTSEEDRLMGEALLGDAKEQREHNFAARFVEKALRDLCEQLTWDPAPKVSKFKNVQHLSTAFQGTNRKGRDILEFVEALHPTPSVAGVPTKRAVELIRELEGMDRGWYSGPVGWMDHKGRGEFAIAIRSGLVTESRAYLYGGAGIVEGSDVEKEYGETELKMRGLREALGVGGG